MWKRIDRYVDKHHIIEDGDRILLGFSGGADSVCLASYLLSLREEGRIDLAALHVNHELRGEESREDERFAEEFCRLHRIPLEISRVDVAGEARRLGLSLEEAGRLVRYRLLRETADRKDCNRIAVAHHRGDQAETLLLHQIRGSGFRGLVGMKPRQKELIRPLLDLSRAEILTILKRLGQDYREDSSNRSLDYHRNYIRHRILPDMKQINPGAENHLADLAGRMADLEDYLLPILDKTFAETVDLFQGVGPDHEGRPEAVLIRQCLNDRHPFEQMEMIRRALALVSGKEKDLGRIHYEILRQLLHNKIGRRNNLPEDVLAVRIRPGLLLVKRTEADDPALYAYLMGLGMTGAEADGLTRMIKGEGNGSVRESRKAEDDRDHEDIVPVPGPGEAPMCMQGELVRADVYYLEGNDPGTIKTDCRICLDYDKIKGQLVFRHRKAGDYLICDRQGHKKLLKRYFIDERIPASFRSSCIMLAQGSHVLWVETGRISEDCRVGEKTRHMLVIELDKIKEMDG